MKAARIGIVGTGQRVCHHGGCLFGDMAEDSGGEYPMKIAALCDHRPERLAEAKGVYEAHFGCQVATYEDYTEMFAKAGLDGVYIASPNDLHRDMTVAALESGIRVLCEKPMEVSLAKCDEMIAAVKRTGGILGFAMQMRYRRRYHKVREFIEQGMIGEPAMVWCTEYRETFAAMKDWVWEKRRSGGAIVEKNCHHYDILNLWVQSSPTTVYATGNIMKHRSPYGRASEIVDNAWVVNDFECGARALVGVCFLAGKPQGHVREFGVMGTEGKIFFSWVDGEHIHVQRSNGDTMDLKAEGVLRGGLCRDFVRCVHTGEQPLVTPEMARDSILVPLAAEKAIEEKRVVHVSELA